jgi:hypothetical protein
MKSEIIELRKLGFSYREISLKLNCSLSTISYHCNKENLNDIGLFENRKVKIISKQCENGKVQFKFPLYKKERRFSSKACFQSSDYIKTIGSISGLKSAKVQKEIRRSKNEIYFYELCLHHFDKVLKNESIFNGWDADIILPNEKIAVLWNGKWHYEKITESHSVNQVQNRDKIKIGEIKKIGYKPYVIKDMGTHNPDFVREEFDKFLKYIAGN